MFASHKQPPPRRWYCTRCRESVSEQSHTSLCPNCGERLIVQGYCPVCEDFVRLPAEAFCPKHDVVLEDGPPPPREPIAAGRHVSWVTVKVFPDSLAAAVPRSRLEAEGIPTFVDGERMGSPAMYRVATGGVKLQVPADQADDARIILAQSWSLPGDEKDDFEDLL
jgi:ribosomal protein S27AE